MGKIKYGPLLVLDQMILYQMLSDQDFFRRVPVFFFMKDTSKAVTDKIVTALLAKDGGDCAECDNVRVQMMPLMQIFARQLDKIIREAPEALEALVAYISERRGYRPRRIMVYYKDETGTTRKLEF